MRLLNLKKRLIKLAKATLYNSELRLLVVTHEVPQLLKVVSQCSRPALRLELKKR